MERSSPVFALQLLLRWIILTISLFVACLLLPGIRIEWNAIIALVAVALLIGFINALPFASAPSPPDDVIAAAECMVSLRAVDRFLTSSGVLVRVVIGRLQAAVWLVARQRQVFSISG